MKGHTLGRIGLIALSLGLLVVVSGCDMLEEEMLQLVATEWLNENRGTAVRQTVTGSTGNPEADAALEPWDVLKEIEEADMRMEVGRRDRDPYLMAEAIKERPGDWTYRTSYGALLVEMGDLKGAQGQFESADELVQANGQRDWLRYVNQGIAELEAVEVRLANGPMSGDQCEFMFDRLAYYYRVRATLTGSDNDATVADRYAEDAKRCKQ